MNQGPVILLFTDLDGSEVLRDRAGDELVQRRLREHHRLLKRLATVQGGQAPRWMGDGWLTLFVSPQDAIDCATAMQRAARRRAAGERLAIRVGLHVGEALQEETDYVGTPVVIARRICDLARGGQIVCSAGVVGLLVGAAPGSVRELGVLVLEGVAAPVAVSEILDRRSGPVALLTELPFVGREAELARLMTRLRAARATAGGLAMLVGEPGIGKTRTLEEFGETARTEGAVVLSGRCYEGEAARPYGPFVEALTECASKASPEVLRADAGLGAAVLARLVPAVRERLVDVPEPVALHPDEETARLQDAIAQFFVAHCGRTPVVLTIDDLHWADPASIALLRHLARVAARTRLLLVGAYRDVEVVPSQPLLEALGELARETNYEHIPLVGLEAGDVAQLLGTMADGEVPAVLATALAVETSGNPFFVREIVLHLAEEGKLLPPAGRWTANYAVEQMGIPQSVRQVIRRRLSRLPEQARQLLGAAAGFTGSFRLDVAARVAGLDESAALDAFDAALEAQLVRATSRPESFDFAHALVRHTLYAELSPPRQVRLHRQIAEAMADTSGDTAIEDAGEIARHYHHSATLPGADRGAPFAVLAADRAERSAAFTEAADHLRTALALLPQDDHRRPRLLARLTLALVGSLSFEAAVETAIRTGAQLAQTEGNEAALAFLADAADAAYLSEPHAWLIAAEGLRLVGERRDRTWARLMVHDVQRREAADPDFPGIPIDSTERRAVAALLWPLPASASPAQFLAAYVRFRSREDVLRLASDQPGALAWWAGEYRRALPLLEEAIAVALDRGQLGNAALYRGHRARLYAARGDLVASKEEYRLARELVDRLGNPPWLRPQVGVVVTNWRWVTGEGWERSLAAIELNMHRDSAENLWLAAVERGIAAECAAQLGQADKALRWLAQMVPAIQRAPASASNYPLVLATAVSTLEAVGRTDHVETIERNLREKWLEPDFRYCGTDARFSLAQLCGLQGRIPEAVEWFDKARLVLDEEGSRPLRARVDFHEARTYLRRGGAGDSARAARLLDTALEQFRVIGMPGWIRLAEELRAQCGNGDPDTAAGHRAVDDTAPPVADEVVFRNEGQYWTVSFAGAAVRMRDTRGIRYLACLARAPGHEMSCQDLAADAGSAAAASLGAAALRSARLEQTRDLSGTGPALDGRAKVEYRRRLAELATALEEAERFNDTGHTDRLRREIELLETQLVAAVGLGGRDRAIASSAERARIAVRKRIKLAITQIATHHASLGWHLSATVKTGQLCSYRPQPTGTGTSPAR